MRAVLRIESFDDSFTRAYRDYIVLSSWLVLRLMCVWNVWMVIFYFRYVQ